MTPELYLSQYGLLDASINAKIEQMRRLRERATQVSPSQSDGGHSGCTSDKVSNIVAKIADLSAEINADIARLVDLEREIKTAISKVPDAKLQLLLTLRYINCKTWEQIAVSLGCSYTHVCRLHAKALSSFGVNTYYYKFIM